MYSRKDSPFKSDPGKKAPELDANPDVKSLLIEPKPPAPCPTGYPAGFAHFACATVLRWILNRSEHPETVEHLLMASGSKLA